MCAVSFFFFLIYFFILISSANLSICLSWYSEREDRSDNSAGKTTESEHCVLRPIAARGSLGLTRDEFL